MPSTPARRRTAAAAVSIVLSTVLVLAGCSSSDDPPAASDRSSTTTTTPARAATDPLTTDAVAGTTKNTKVLEALQAWGPYVQQQGNAVAIDVKRFTDAVRAGDIELAKELYPVSRQAWSRIEPLVPLIADIGDVVAVRPAAGADPAVDPELTGWHQLEWDLWVAGDVSGSKATADQLDEEVAKLAAAVNNYLPTPLAMTEGNAQLMAWAARDAPTGDAQPFSHTDVWDLAARLDAANAARQMERGAVGDADPDLAARIDTGFEKAIKAIEPYRTAEGWMLYDQVTEAQRAELEQHFAALADDLAKVAGALELT